MYVCIYVLESTTKYGINSKYEENLKGSLNQDLKEYSCANGHDATIGHHFVSQQIWCDNDVPRRVTKNY